MIGWLLLLAAVLMLWLAATGRMGQLLANWQATA